jgi:CheY-like chemotaxis protein
MSRIAVSDRLLTNRLAIGSTARTQSPTAGAPMLPAMRVLCVDDEEDIRTILALALSLDSALEVDIVPTGPDLLTRAREGAWDAFVLDGMMPDMDGWELCRRLKADPATASVPVVFLTAKTQREEVARALALGATACLTKPFDPLTLAGDLRSALGRPPG